MCDHAKWYIFGQQRHKRFYWKIRVHPLYIKSVILTENADGSMRGERLFTKERYPEDNHAFHLSAFVSET